MPSPTPSLAAVTAAVEAGWGPDTCDPHDLPLWHAGNPARGQCGVTALVVHDLLGGELLLAEHDRDGARYGVHWWNRLPDGTEVDLTRAQLGPGEAVGRPEVVVRPAGPPVRARAQYELLRARVLAHLGSPEAPSVDR